MCGLLEHDDYGEMSFKITGHRFPESVGPLLGDWISSTNQDSSTTLALLDHTTGHLLSLFGRRHFETGPEIDKALEYATSLATWLAQNDPAKMSSRGYIRWMIAKAYRVAIRDPEMLNHRKLLMSSPGVVFHSVIPRYIPVDSENPGWRRPKTLGQVTNAMKLAVNAARDLEDYETEALALKFLISITNEPESEVKELRELQYRIQGCKLLHTECLIASYLWSKSEESKSRLKEDLAELLFRPGFDLVSYPSQRWTANMLFHALEKEGPRAEKAIVAADDCVQHLHKGYVEDIEAKIPDFHEQIDQRKAFRQKRAQLDNINEEQGKLNEERAKIEIKQAELDARRKEADAEKEKADISRASPDELRVILTPAFSDRRKIKLSIENIDGTEDKREITYQHDLPRQPSSHAQEHESASEAAQPREIELTLRRDGTEFESEIHYLRDSSSDEDELESEARAQPSLTPSHNPHTRQHDRPKVRSETSQSSKEAKISHSDGIPPSDIARQSYVEIVSDPPSEQSSPVQSAHRGISKNIGERHSSGSLDEDQITVLEMIPPDEDRLPDPTSPETRSGNSSHSQVQIADSGAGTEGTKEPSEQHRVDSVHVKQMSREPSIEPVRRSKFFHYV